VKIYTLRTTIGRENIVMEEIRDKAKSNGYNIKAIIHPKQLKGYVMIEGDEDDIREAIKNIRYAKGLIGKPVDIEEIKRFLESGERKIEIHKGDIVEIIGRSQWRCSRSLSTFYQCFHNIFSHFITPHSLDRIFPILGVNIGEVIKKINEKTKDFEGMKVPVKVIVDDKKNVEIEVGTPPVSALIKKEAKVEKLSSNPKEEKIADLKIEQIIKIAKAKRDSMNTDYMKSLVKQVIGTCVSAGILVEGKDPKIVLKEIDEGKYHDEIIHEKTEISEKELKELEEEKKRLAEERERYLSEMREKAQKIIKEMAGKERKEILTRLEEEEIPREVIDEVLPKEGEKKEAKVSTDEKKK